MAMCSPFHDGRASSARRTSGTLTLTTISRSKSRPGVHVEVLVRRAGEAVVADDTVGDEVAGPGRDVVEPHRHAERLDGTTRVLRVGLQRHARDRALAGDRRIGRVEEPQPLAQAAADSQDERARWRATSSPRAMSKPNCRRHAAVQSRSGARPCWRCATPRLPHEPSASKIPARKPLRQSSLGASGQAISSPTRSTRARRRADGRARTLWPSPAEPKASVATSPRR